MNTPNQDLTRETRFLNSIMNLPNREAILIQHYKGLGEQERTKLFIALVGKYSILTQLQPTGATK
ncbi:hypothetical protein A7P95_07390 [Eikenella longinqua]|jgi:hypothetical protein|uniref:Uncharacterized protein n=1 Tax=Eikenella longinqua TaxID=1795827 RepID=A0A1A9RX06_9NEIS|nr:hypothetical protein [Eikenella longinqua]OAM27054.1 hypothetical protein A7P95_07390 [Eikenella longinqua]